MKILLFILFFLPVLAQAQTPPTGSGGPRQTIQLPTSSVTLAGTAAGTGGATIVSTVWSWYVSSSAGTINPSAGTITTPGSLTSTVTSLSAWGNNILRLIITDNHGLKDTVYTTINVIPACNGSAGRRLTIGLTQTTPTTEIFRPTTAQTSTGAIGGDTIIMPRNNGKVWDLSWLGTISGDPCRDIVIMWDSTALMRGRIVIGPHSQYLTYDLTNVRIVGGGGDAVDGFQFNHITIKNFLIDSAAGGAGMLLKTIADTSNLETIYPNYPLTRLTVINGIVQNTHDNGFYIGTTNPSGTDPGQPPGVPPRMDSVRVAHVRLFNIGQTAISVSAAGNGMSIDSNYMHNVGTRLSGSPFSVGIEAGGSTNGDIFGDTLVNIVANGIQEFGYGIVNIHDNLLDSCGNNAGSDGHESFLLNDPPDLIVSNPAMQPNIYNNLFKHPYAGVPAIHAYNGFGTMLGASVHDNQFCIPGANPVTWASTYLSFSPAATLTNNTLIVCGPVLKIGLNLYRKLIPK